MNILYVLSLRIFSFVKLCVSLFVFSFLAFQTNIYSQLTDIKLNGDSVSETVTDFDGNIYNVVQIGNQKWMKESLKSLHYADSTDIVGAMAYNNNQTIVQTYGRLYTWYAVMKNVTTAGTQGICPNGWHVPTDGEWTELVNYSGGENVAGGHLKEAGTSHWRSPNTGADNSSGFTALPSGMYFDGAFHYLRYNVEFWSSSDSHDLFAWYRILYFDQNYIVRTDYFDKNSLRSVRCLSNETTGIIEEGNNNKPENFYLEQNYPNPFNPETCINFNLQTPGFTKLKIYDILGNELITLIDEYKNAGAYSINFNTASVSKGLSSGVYIYQLCVANFTKQMKMILIK